MLNRYLIGAVVLITYSAGLWFHGNHHGRQTAELQTAHAWLDAAEQARQVEREQQEKVNDSLRQQYQDQLAISAGLAADLERLQRRPARTGLPEPARTDCPPATGADLSREDASFLVREAARADQLRTALGACYDYADAIAGN